MEPTNYRDFSVLRMRPKKALISMLISILTLVFSVMAVWFTLYVIDRNKYYAECRAGFDEESNKKIIRILLSERGRSVDEKSIHIKIISYVDYGAFYNFKSGSIVGIAFGDNCGIYDLNALKL